MELHGDVLAVVTVHGDQSLHGEGDAHARPGGWIFQGGDGSIHWLGFGADTDEEVGCVEIAGPSPWAGGCPPGILKIANDIDRGASLDLVSRRQFLGSGYRAAQIGGQVAGLGPVDEPLDLLELRGGLGQHLGTTGLVASQDEAHAVIGTERFENR